MKFLVDNALSPLIAKGLREAGFEADEEPRSPEGFRDEVSYRKELLFPYSLANPAASCEECARYPIHVRDIGMHSASDQIIVEYAKEEDLTIVTADTDFGTLLALWRYSRPSVIIFRTSIKHPETQLALLLNQTSEISDALSEGSIVVFEDTRIRIRPLPIF